MRVPSDRKLMRRTALANRRRPSGKMAPFASKVADRGLLWPGAAAALAIPRRSRAAALTGIAAVGATSITSATVAAVAGRDRPPRVLALFTRGSARRPSSGSLPSTHATNAWAFGTAVSTIHPVAALITVPAAAAIAASRAWMAHHYPTDVVTGSASSSEERRDC